MDQKNLKTIYLILSLIFLMNSAHAAYYLNNKVYCAPHEERTEKPIGNVRPEWIRKGPSDQGASNTCGFHASIDMITALYRSKHPDASINPKINPFSVLDSIIKFQKKSAYCGIENASTNIVAQLLKIQHEPELSVGPITQVTMNRALEMNSLLSCQAKSCASGICPSAQVSPNGCHLECLSSLCSSHRPFLGLPISMEELKDISSKISPELKDPIILFTEEKRKNRESIPPFQIQTWDTFSSTQEITDQVVEYFKGGESILPLGMSFCQRDQGDEGCIGKHVVAAHALKEISCKDLSTGRVRSFHAISLMGSIPTMDQGDFILEDLTQGMFKHQLGLAAITPCTQQDHCHESPILNTPQSHAFFHYADAGDIENMLKVGGSGEPFKKIFKKSRGHSGLTALHQSAMNHDLPLVTALLQKDVPLDSTDQLGETALYISSQNGFADLVRLLLAAGANPDLPRISDLQNPIFIAASKGHTEVVRELIKSGAQVNYTVSFDQATPLFMASQNGHKDVVELLLKHGAQARTQLTNGQSALHAAVREGHTEIIILLLQHGAGEEIRNGDRTQIWEMTRLLQASNPKDKKWMTILELLKPFRKSP